MRLVLGFIAAALRDETTEASCSPGSSAGRLALKEPDEAPPLPAPSAAEVAAENSPEPCDGCRVSATIDTNSYREGDVRIKRSKVRFVCKNAEGNYCEKCEANSQKDGPKHCVLKAAFRADVPVDAGVQTENSPDDGARQEVGVQTESVRTPLAVHSWEGPPVKPLKVKPLQTGDQEHVKGLAVQTDADEVERGSARAPVNGRLDITPDDAHHEFELRKGGAATALYIRTGPLCGAELFSEQGNQNLDCDELPFSPLTAAYDPVPMFARGLDLPRRAFGVELELLTREPKGYGPLRREDPLGCNMGAAAYVSGECNRIRLKACVDKKTRYRGRTLSCNGHTECPIAHYCRKPQPSRLSKLRNLLWNGRAKTDVESGENSCKPRADCDADKSVDGTCPVPLDSWLWTNDISVKRLPEAIAREIGGTYYEQWKKQSYVGVEIISPPLDGPPGFKSVSEMLWTLEDMGVEAGPSMGMHVHINVGKPGSGSKYAGSPLSPAQIANVWAHYARFQLVLDEFLIDSRVQNKYTKGLLLQAQFVLDAWNARDGKPQSAEAAATMEEQLASAAALKTVFQNMHRFLHSKEPMPPEEFCDAIWGYSESYENRSSINYRPCSRRYPKERYYQLNLVALLRLGTIEFRGFPATRNKERALRWVYFLLRFVETYKDDDRFFRGAVGEDLDRLAEAQASPETTLDVLEREIGADLSYFRERTWLRGLPCDVEKGKNTGVDWSLVFDQLPPNPEEGTDSLDSPPPLLPDSADAAESAAPNSPDASPRRQEHVSTPPFDISEAAASPGLKPT
jgi:hypothetical protein